MNAQGNAILLRVIARLNEWGHDDGWRAAAHVLWPLVEPVPTVTTVLGESRPATGFAANGDFFCPFCTNPVWRSKGETTCQNPACDAHPMLSPESLKARLEKRTKEERERADRERTNAYRIQEARDRNARHAEWQQEQVAEARRRGACLNCLFQSGWERVKFIRHRGPCPKER